MLKHPEIVIKRVQSYLPEDCISDESFARAFADRSSYSIESLLQDSENKKKVKLQGESLSLMADATYSFNLAVSSNFGTLRATSFPTRVSDSRQGHNGFHPTFSCTIVLFRRAFFLAIAAAFVVHF